MTLFQKREKLHKELDLGRILFALSIPYVALGFSQNGFLSLLPFVREEFSLNRVQIGYYSTSFFLSAALLAVFAGSIVDRLGPKRSILFGIGSTSLMLMGYGLSPSYTLILFMAIIAGLGVSFITPSVIKGSSLAAPLEKRGISLGIVQSGYSIGSIAGASILPFLGKNFGWRVAVQITAAGAILIGFLVYFLYQENKDGQSKKEIFYNSIKREMIISFKKNLLALFQKKSLLRLCVLGIIFGISEGAVLSHFAIFLSEDLNMNRILAGLGLGILHIGGIIGLTGWGWTLDRLFKRRRKLILLVIGLVTGLMNIFFGLFINTPQLNPIIIFLFSFILGLGAIGWSGAYFVVIGELAGEERAGIATGLSLLFIRTGILFAPLGFGFIADMKGNYESSWLLFGLIIIGVSLLFLLPEPSPNKDF